MVSIRNTNIKIIFCSHDGFNGHFGFKPFSQAELFSAIQDCIKQEQISRTPGKTDFSALLSGERNRKEMLGLFIRETGKDMAILEKSIQDAAPATVSPVIHRLLPVWELIQVGGALKYLLHLPDVLPGEMSKETEQAIRDVIEQGHSAIRQAQLKIKPLEDE
jgi:hypothetical protein